MTGHGEETFMSNPFWTTFDRKLPADEEDDLHLQCAQNDPSHVVPLD